MFLKCIVSNTPPPFFNFTLALFTTLWFFRNKRAFSPELNKKGPAPQSTEPEKDKTTNYFSRTGKSAL